MKRHLFLTGPAFCGKSNLIRELLGKRLQAAGGFCTEMSTDESEGVLGCSMMPAAMAGGVEGFEKELFLDLRCFPPTHDSEVFRGMGEWERIRFREPYRNAPRWYRHFFDP